MARTRYNCTECTFCGCFLELSFLELSSLQLSWDVDSSKPFETVGLFSDFLFELFSKFFLCAGLLSCTSLCARFELDFIPEFFFVILSFRILSSSIWSSSGCARLDCEFSTKLFKCASSDVTCWSASKSTVLLQLAEEVNPLKKKICKIQPLWPFFNVFYI